jgi:hypothetical protein
MDKGKQLKSVTVFVDGGQLNYRVGMKLTTYEDKSFPISLIQYDEQSNTVRLYIDNYDCGVTTLYQILRGFAVICEVI